MMRQLKVAFVSFAMLAWAAPALALTAEDAINMAVEAEGLLLDLQIEMETMMGTIEPAEGVQTIDGIEYNVVEYQDPVTGKILKMIYTTDGQLVKSELSDQNTGITLTTEYDENGNAVAQTIM